MKTFFFLAILLSLGPMLIATPGRADTIDAVTLNTSALTTSPGDLGAPFALAFSLADGGVPGNNTVTLSDFSFGTGSASGSAIPSDCVSSFFTCGGESGVISQTSPGASVVSLTDSGFYNGLVEAFTPGNTLSFLLDFTTNPDSCAGCADDTFVFQILTPCASATDACSNLQTTDTFASSFVTVDLSTKQVSSFSSTSPAGVTATVTPTTPTPEPSTWLLLGSGLASLGFLRKRMKG